MQLTTCCGCFSLKAGTIAIGVCGIVLTVISLITIFTSDVAWERASKDIRTEDIDDKTMKTIKVIYAVANCISILISALLIAGALKKNTCMMLPWLILDMVGIVGLSVNFLHIAIMAFITSDVFIGILELVIGLMIIMIATYLWLVVYYYLKQIRIEKMNDRMNKEPHNFQQI